MDWRFDLGALAGMRINEIILDAYHHEIRPIIEGIGVVVLPTLAMQFR